MNYNLLNENFTENYVENLLRARGVDNFEEYMSPSDDKLQSPHDLKNIGIAAALYLRIIQKEHPHILLIVDADMDGFTSAAIFYKYTKQVNGNCQIDYWLHSGKQHGLADHIDSLMDSGINYDLIVLPDSSSNDATYHDMLYEIHLPCLILDHHLTDVALSDNAVVVNNQLSPNYHNKELTGAGIVYQFCRYIDEKLGSDWANEYIDLAACGIIGDMGSVIEIENRYIIKKGLKSIKNEMLIALLEKAGYSITGKSNPSWQDIEEKINPISVAFYLVPMVNALIRVGTMEEKELLFKGFINGNEMVPCNKRGAKGTLERACIEATRICTNAKNKQNKIKEEAVNRIEAKIFKYDLLENKILFIRLEEDDKFPPELNGLVAMQLSARYQRPTIVARLGEDGFDKGSMRGLNQSELNDFKSFLMESGYFEWCQGHANAAGCCIHDEKLSDFHKYANEALKDVDFGTNSYGVNFIRQGNSADLRQLILAIGGYEEIWGQGNQTPLICIENIPVSKDNIRVMGSAMDTLKIEYNGIAYMKFKAKDLINELQSIESVMKMNIIGKANINEWGGNITPQIFIEDFDINTNKIIDF